MQKVGKTSASKKRVVAKLTSAFAHCKKFTSRIPGGQEIIIAKWDQFSQLEKKSRTRLPLRATHSFKGRLFKSSWLSPIHEEVGYSSCATPVSLDLFQIIGIWYVSVVHTPATHRLHTLVLKSGKYRNSRSPAPCCWANGRGHGLLLRLALRARDWRRAQRR